MTPQPPKNWDAVKWRPNDRLPGRGGVWSNVPINAIRDATIEANK